MYIPRNSMFENTETSLNINLNSRLPLSQMSESPSKSKVSSPTKEKGEKGKKKKKEEEKKEEVKVSIMPGRRKPCVLDDVLEDIQFAREKMLKRVGNVNNDASSNNSMKKKDRRKTIKHRKSIASMGDGVSFQVGTPTNHKDSLANKSSKNT